MGEIEAELKKEGVETEKVLISEDEVPLPDLSRLFTRADLILIGSPVSSWTGEISPLIERFLGKGNLLQGRRTAVFVNKSLLGGRKALKKLMKLVEKCGSFLVDFEILSSSSQTREFSNRLISLGNPGPT